MEKITDLRKLEIARMFPNNRFDSESWNIILRGSIFYNRLQMKALVYLGYINDVCKVRAVNPHLYSEFTKELDILVDDLLVVYVQLWVLQWLDERSNGLIL